MLNLRKKLLVSIFTLMLALVAVSTTTYAWFTLGNEAKVSNIDLSVKGTDGLMIRLKSVNGTLMSADPLYNLSTELDLSGKTAGVKLAPLYHTGDKLVELKENNTKDAYVPGTDGVAVNSGKLIHLEFEIYSPSLTKITFSSILAKSKSDTYTFKAQKEVVSNFGATGAVGTIDEIAIGGNIANARLANALRVAYDVTTTLSAEASLSVAKNYVQPAIYDEANQLSTVDALKKQYGTWHDGASTSYFNDFSDIPLDTTGIVEYDYIYKTTDLGVTPLITLDGNTTDGFYATVVITIWLEGFDADCFNAIVNDSALLSLSFKSVA